MSRMPVALLLAALPLPASAAEPLTSEQAIENYRTKIIERPHCPNSGNPDDIVVCGRRSPRNAYLLPLPVEPAPGERVRGEPISTVAAGEEFDKCSPAGPNPKCVGGLPVLGFAIFLAKVVEKKIINPDD